MSARKAITLIAGKFGSRHFGTKPYLADALKRTGKDKPLALYVGVASGDDPTFGTALGGLLTAAGARRVLWPKLATRRKQSGQMRQALAEADLVFVGGGDVEAGMDLLRGASLLADFHAAADRGAVFAAMSAGSIMLGKRWIRWPNADADDDEAETYECLGIVPVAVDTHGEGDEWQEARSYAAVRAREIGKKARAYCVPSGGALVIDHRGRIEAHGVSAPVFEALPKRKAKLEETLEVTK
ncbi:MAG: Type 1 glutamine amidotransferase-like domain-containing protein [Gammaproteobacteria bacterium]